LKRFLAGECRETKERRLKLALGLLACIGLASCGGGGGGDNGSLTTNNNGGGSSIGGGSTNTWTSGVFKPSANFAAQCAAPRTGTDPGTGKAYPDVKGSTLSENNWLRSWTNELYLWFDEVPDRDPSLYATADYFNQLKTPQTDSAGQPKDKFHFTYATSTWETLSSTNTEAGYGVQWVLLANTPPRELVVAFTTPNTPAAAANLARGAEILTIDGVDLVNDNTQSGINTLNAGISPTKVGETHSFTVRDLGASTTRTVTLTAQNVTQSSVPLVTTLPTANGKVGYIEFNDHQATAESGLVNAVNQLAAAGIKDLVLDMRYNGGGYLDIANELAYMIAGPGPTAGRTFYNQQFNSKNPNTNPVTGTPLSPEGFHTLTQGFTVSAGQSLPTLNLSRVFVLTGPSTCSASEAVINGLDGVNVQVIQIGTTTCGKPYGFYAQDNCGTTYFSIEFRGVNATGFGNYPDGFSPSSTLTAASGAALPGCSVADDFTHALGDTAEARLAAALTYASSGSCPTQNATPGGLKQQRRPLSATDGPIVRTPGREILIVRP
jgi:carboxyl-terminal processing protease